MEELIPGVFHWTAYRDTIGQDVHSYYVVGARAVIDPMLPDEGLGWFEGERHPDCVVLSQRHHWRDSAAFGVPVRCQEDGARLLAPDRPSEPFAYGDEPAPGIVAYPVWAAGWPGETALHLSHAGAVVLADAVIRDASGALAFVPDQFLGDDAGEAKRELSAGLTRLLDLDFDALLLAHGDPVASGGKDELSRFLA
ncbi:MAG TPA: hypothetical protein VFB41_00135 [Solirubrobacteraceae bacterium]|nr:hypothetical protein [Solirubrobacteraceae bacterium]